MTWNLKYILIESGLSKHKITRQALYSNHRNRQPFIVAKTPYSNDILQSNDCKKVIYDWEILPNITADPLTWPAKVQLQVSLGKL